MDTQSQPNITGLSTSLHMPLPPPAYVREQLDIAMWRTLRPATIGFAALYLLFSIAHPFVIAQEGWIYVEAASAASAVLFFAAWGLLRQTAPRPKFAYFIAFCFLLIILLNSILHMAITQDAKQSTNFVLVILAVGAFFLSRRWAVIGIATAWAAWAGTVAFAAITDGLVHYTFALLTGTVLAVIAITVRLNALRRAVIAGWAEHQQRVKVEKAEVEIQRANAELEQRVRERTLQLQQEAEERIRAEDAAREAEKLAVTGRLAATMAHEINNPLEAVSNLIYLMLTAKDMESVRRYATLAQDEIGRVSHITKQTLSFYRDSSAAMVVDVGMLVKDVIELYRPKMQSSAVGVVAEIADNATLTGFLGELRQVISNIVLNAIDASERGGEIRIRVRKENGNGWGPRGVRITIADRGHGIRPEARSRIFQPFFTTKQQKGTGLGLWVSRGIVVRHGGRLHIYSSTSEQRHGTAVSVWLPEEIPPESVHEHRRRFEAQSA